MLSSCSRIALAVTASLTLLASAPAFSAQRTFVSTTGVDNPACSLVSQCRTFAAAIAATSPNGEVIVLDSGGYGKVTITQSVSIIAAPGVYAGISVFAPDDGVTVAAGASDKVTLRGLTINGQGGNDGIVITSGGEVYIQQCTVANMFGNGIRIDGGTHIHIRGSIVQSNNAGGLLVSDLGAPEIHIVDSQFSRNSEEGIRVNAGTLDATRVTSSDNTSHGVLAQPFNPISVGVTLTDSVLTGNGGGGVGNTGVYAYPFGAGSIVRVAIVRSTIARNKAAGVASTLGAGTAFVMVSDSAVVENGFGVDVSSPSPTATIVVTGSTVAGNTSFDFLQIGAGELRSSGTNTLTGRGAADISGTITPDPLK